MSAGYFCPTARSGLDCSERSERRPVTIPAMTPLRVRQLKLLTTTQVVTLSLVCVPAPPGVFESGGAGTHKRPVPVLKASNFPSARTVHPYRYTVTPALM